MDASSSNQLRSVTTVNFTISQNNDFKRIASYEFRAVQCDKQVQL